MIRRTDAAMGKDQKKEMITLQENPDGSIDFWINYSSMTLINSCLRKTYYKLEQGYEEEDPSLSLVFGTALHKALEVWYLSDPKERKELPKSLPTKISNVIFGQDEGNHPAFRAAAAFARVFNESGVNPPDDDRRSLYNGAKILSHYFQTYATDGFSVVWDDHGPIIERRVEVPDLCLLLPSDTKAQRVVRVHYHGTIDAVLENKQTKVICVVDHKTTYQLGAEFFNRINPNHQYTGYLLGAKKALGIETDKFLVNAIQVAKTRTNCARQFTSRSEHDFAEFREAVRTIATKYINAKYAHNYADCPEKSWTLNAPEPCTNWGRCEFLKVCSSPYALRQTLLNNNYRKTK